MYQISLWASRHVWPSRIAIVMLYGIITVLALFIGDALQLFQIAIPISLFYAAAGVFLIVFSIYPEKRYKHRYQHFYRYRKTADAILVTTTFFFVVCTGNQPQRMWRLGTQPAAATAVAPNQGSTANPAEGLKKKKSVSKKPLRRLLFQKISVLRKMYKETSKGGKIALLILTIIVAAGLLSLLAAFSCSLSCSGSEGLAALVALGGVSLVTFLLIRVIRRIERGPKHKKAVST